MLMKIIFNCSRDEGIVKSWKHGVEAGSSWNGRGSYGDAALRRRDAKAQRVVESTK
jgi:hypothetical protein